MGGHDYGSVDDAASRRAIGAAIDRGITFFDTADVYGFGRAERVLGGALEGRRDRVVIATKGGVRWYPDGRTERTIDPSYLMQALHESLQRLRTDVIDLYQLHWPVPGVSVEPALEALGRAREEGKVRAIGLCNFDAASARAAAHVYPVATEQVGFNVGDRQHEDRLRSATADGRLTLVYNVLAQGLFAGRHRATEQFGGTDLRARYGYFQPSQRARLLPLLERIHCVADRVARTPLQVAIRWALEHPDVGAVVTGIKYPWQVEENAGALGWRLSPEDLRFLTESSEVTGPTRTGTS